MQKTIENLIKQNIFNFKLKGKGAVNNAYYFELENGLKYIVKQELDIKEFEPENDLITEAKIIDYLNKKGIFTSIPKILFISEIDKIYCYEYIEGNTLKDIWTDLPETERINILNDLGKFHAEIGKVFDKKDIESVGIKIDDSIDMHPESQKEYLELIEDKDIPEHYINLVKKARDVLDNDNQNIYFQLLHNDAHHENIIIDNKNISGYIDFGNAQFGEITKEFSRYIRDFPNHFQYIVESYEKESGNNLSMNRLVAYSLLSGFIDIVEDYKKGGVFREKADRMMEGYKVLL